MEQMRSKSMTIQQIEKAVNHLLSKHESSFHQWVNSRMDMAAQKKTTVSPKKKSNQKAVKAST
jgi:DNA-binding transcriptional regulator YdaS (Cro superfamily)